MTTATPNAPTALRNEAAEIRIVSHSTLFYWWPVWAIGFLMAAITWLDGTDMAVVPSGSKVVVNTTVHGAEGQHDVLVLPSKKAWPDQTRGKEPMPIDPHLRMSGNKNLGVLFCAVLLLVVAITNIPLRGLWSVIVIVFLISLIIILALLEWWHRILEWISILDIRINMAGYVLISSALFILWLIVFFFFDRQIYMVFTPGQLRVRLEIGEAETAYDSAGMTIQKQRSDLFRHWILGFGSGDLIVKTSGAQAHTFDMPNVLFLGRRVREIEDMMRSRPVVAAPPH